MVDLKTAQRIIKTIREEKGTPVTPKDITDAQAQEYLDVMTGFNLINTRYNEVNVKEFEGKDQTAFAIMVSLLGFSPMEAGTAQRETINENVNIARAIIRKLEDEGYITNDIYNEMYSLFGELGQAVETREVDKVLKEEEEEEEEEVPRQPRREQAGGNTQEVIREWFEQHAQSPRSLGFPSYQQAARDLSNQLG